jgi:hypothetical protein
MLFISVLLPSLPKMCFFPRAPLRSAGHFEILCGKATRFERDKLLALGERLRDFFSRPLFLHPLLSSSATVPRSSFAAAFAAASKPPIADIHQVK